MFARVFSFKEITVTLKKYVKINGFKKKIYKKQTNNNNFIKQNNNKKLNKKIIIIKFKIQKIQ